MQASYHTPSAMAAAEQNVVRMRLGCRDADHFMKEFAPKMTTRIFVPMDAPAQVGDRITLHIRFADGSLKVKGAAEVIKVVQSPRDGVHVRFVALDADSLQFPIGNGPSSTAIEAVPTGETQHLPFKIGRAHV